MNKTLLFLIIFIGLPTALGAQRPTKGEPKVAVTVKAEDNRMGETFPIVATTTQTESKPGWKIVDYQLSDRVTRYLWGAHATQLVDAQTSFILTPGADETLYQYAVIPLKCKREYRRLPKLKAKDNNYLRLTPDDFHIEAVGDSSFLCSPLKQFPPGDYFLLNIEQEPQGELGDYTGYPFRVTKY